MKIAFIQACLEPGRDGVGDYAAALSAECVRQGGSACALAINDAQLRESWAGERNRVQMLRLPSIMPPTERMRRAKRFIEEQQPDWISLQFVSYAYASRGLVFGLARQLKSLCRNRRVEIMFHELWIGRDPGDSLKSRAVGWLQKKLIQSMTRILRPEAVHTSNQYYIEQLRQAGIQAKVLPLFGNLEVNIEPETGWIYECASAAGWPLQPQNRDHFLLFGFFGSIHPVWRPEPLFGRLAEAGRRLGRKLGFISVGRDAAGTAHWAGLEKTYAGKHYFMRLGEQSQARVAGFFRLMDYGLATTPYALIGKSGTTAAMLEQGLPVIVSRDDVPFAGEQTELEMEVPLLIRMGDDLAARVTPAPPRGRPASRLPGVARRFLLELTREGAAKRS